MWNDEAGDGVGFTCLVFQSRETQGCISIIFIIMKTQVARFIIPQL